MKLILERTYKGPNYTIGKLYIDGNYFCDTLEDADRCLKLTDSLAIISSKKVYGKTAIPTGEYNITLNVISPKFKDRQWAIPWKGKLPRLINVPGYDGILIHVGTDQYSTSGCIIVGENKIKGKVINSLVTFNKLMQILTKTKDEIIIIIK